MKYLQAISGSLHNGFYSLRISELLSATLVMRVSLSISFDAGGWRDDARHQC